MKNFLFILAFLFSLSVIPSAFADWTVTTNWTGKWSASVDFVCSPCSNSLTTNLLLSKGFMRGKVIPTYTTIAVTSNVPTSITVTNGTVLNALAVPYVRRESNGTNLAVSVLKVHSQRTAYIRFRVFMRYLRGGEK